MLMVHMHVVLPLHERHLGVCLHGNTCNDKSSRPGMENFCTGSQAPACSYSAWCLALNILVAAAGSLYKEHCKEPETPNLFLCVGVLVLCTLASMFKPPQTQSPGRPGSGHCRTMCHRSS